jgi:hypothetical protein
MSLSNPEFKSVADNPLPGNALRRRSIVARSSLVGLPILVGLALVYFFLIAPAVQRVRNEANRMHSV